jgi:hypothetical protein
MPARFIHAMKSMEISFGQTAPHSTKLEQTLKSSSS